MDGDGCTSAGCWNISRCASTRLVEGLQQGCILQGNGPNVLLRNPANPQMEVKIESKSDKR
jgi:hypothetical protein